MGGERLFHVVLDGRKVGPYDRRTIVGMRVKDALHPDDVLVDADGNRMTVAELIGDRGPEPGATRPAPVGTLNFSATFRGVRGRGTDIPAFRGDVQVRVQHDVLRIAGRYRKGLGWKEDRVKLPMVDVQHAQASGADVDVALAGDSPGSFRWVTFTFADDAAARDFAASLPARGPQPDADVARPGGGLLASVGAMLGKR